MSNDNTDDQLYIMVGKEYYRLTASQITADTNKIDKTKEPQLTEYLDDLVNKNVILADIEAKLDSCVCIALNVGYLQRVSLDDKTAFIEKNSLKKSAVTVK